MSAHVRKGGGRALVLLPPQPHYLYFEVLARVSPRSSGWQTYLNLAHSTFNKTESADTTELPPTDPLLYCRSNTRMFGSRRPGVCTVIVKVLRSEESLNRSVPVILPLNLSVISRVCAFTPSCRGRRT
jgi:hypothetical protein